VTAQIAPSWNGSTGRPDRQRRTGRSRVAVPVVLPAAHQGDGLIAGYRAELDRDRAGLGLTVFIALKVEQHSRNTSLQIETALTQIPAVIACYVVSGEADFLIEAVVPSLAAYERLLLDQILAIGPVTDARSTFVIRTVRSRGPLPLTHWTTR